MPDLIAAMEQALAAVLQRARRAAGADRARSRRRTAYFGVMPAALDDPPPWAPSSSPCTPQPRARPAVAPGHHRAARHATGALVGADGRPLHHRSADRRRVRGVGEAPGAARRARAGIIGSGVQARSHLEAIRHVRTLTDVRVWSPSADASRGVRGRDVDAAACRSRADADGGRRGARRRHRRAGDVVADAGRSRTPTSNPGTHIAARRRVPPRSARDADGARRARARLRRLAGRRAARRPATC